VTAAHCLQYEHLIVDNASSDGTGAYIEKFFSSFARVLQNSENMGFASANNRAVKEAKGRYLLFLNPDMRIQEGTLDDMVSWMDSRPDVGIASCKLLDASQKPHPILRPMRFPKMYLYLLALLHIIPPFCSVHPYCYYPDFQDDQEQEVDHVRGAFMLMRKEIVEKLGFAFDPKYFLLLEDLDICREVKRLGYRVVYTPQLSCIDYFGQSLQKMSSCWKHGKFCRSLLVYSKKWHPWHKWIWIHLAIPLSFLFSLRKWGWKLPLNELTKVYYARK